MIEAILSCFKVAGSKTTEGLTGGEIDIGISTPGVEWSFFSIFETHEAQCMPSIESSTV
jgi:hypothetical protein